jgi:Leucine Rich Repeat (LRR) protein
MKRKTRKKIQLALLIVVYAILVLVIIDYFLDNRNINTPENFPDPNFRIAVENYLKVKPGEKFSAKKTKNRKVALLCNGRGIHDLTGIEFFPQIKKLNCSDNQLKEIDISANIGLKMLVCSGNQLTELDLTNQKDLKHLSCENNSLSELNLSNLTNLEYLVCSDNQLTSFDSSRNVKIEYLDCSGNQLTSLDSSRNVKVENLNCSSNKISALKLCAGPVLKRLDCGNNQLSSIDTTGILNLLILKCGDNPLTHLDFSKNPYLTRLICRNTDLQSLNLVGNSSLNILNLYNNKLTSIPDLSGIPRINAVDVRMNLLGDDDKEDIIALKKMLPKQIGEEEIMNYYSSHNQLYSGFHYSPQINHDPYLVD